jgi:hypothetical protein
LKNALTTASAVTKKHQVIGAAGHQQMRRIGVQDCAKKKVKWRNRDRKTVSAQRLNT